MCRVMQEEHILEQVQTLSTALAQRMHQVAEQTGCVTNVRHIGAIAACDLIVPNHPTQRRLGYDIYQESVKQGALLRPIGNTIYWLPPFNTPLTVVNTLYQITTRSIRHVYENL